MASFFEHIGSEVESVADEAALASKIAAEAAKVAAEASANAAASSASDASNSEASVTASITASAASAAAALVSENNATTKALESAASEVTSTTKASESAASAATATTKATEASASAATATTKAAEATSARDDITGLTTATGAAGSSASYNSSTGVLTVPRGDTGVQGVQGIQGPAGQDSTVAGPQGPAGQDSTVAGPQGPAGQDSTVAGPQGVQGVQGPQGVAGVDGTQFDTNVLKVDGTNNRVGVNDTTPSVSLDAGSNTDAIAVPVGTTAQRPADGAGRFRYNSTTQAFEGYTTEWGSIAGGGGTNTFTTDSFTANGSTTAYALSQVTSSKDSLLVFIDGVFQTQDAYAIATASGTTTLTFSAAPANARKIVVYSVAAAVSGSNLNIDSMTGDGSDVTLTLSIAPVTINNTIVTIDGVYQAKANYSISGTTLTFSTAPPSGTAVEVMTFTQTDINVPVDGTITSAKLSGALTTPSDLTVTGALTANGGIDVTGLATASEMTVSDTDDIRLRFLNGTTFKAGIQVATSTGDMIAGSAVDDLAIRSQANMLFSTSGNTEAMRISGGNVGISTSDPKSTLEVKGTFGAPATSGSAAGFISRFSQTSGVGCLDVGFGDPYSWIQSRASNNYATNFDLILQPNGSNVGIGVSAPTYKIDATTTSGGNGLKMARGTNSFFEQFQSTSGGVQLAASGSGAFMAFRTGTTAGTTTERLRLDAAGRVTAPYQPFFHAGRNGNLTGFNASGAFGSAVQFNSTYQNVGNHYNTTTGLFTAPVAGVYVFEACTYMSALAEQSWFVKNGARVIGTDMFVNGHDRRFPDNMTVLILAVNDTVGFHPYVLSNTNVTIIANVNHTYFKGYLLG